jgi:hypothetical protein
LVIASEITVGKVIQRREGEGWSPDGAGPQIQ